MSFSNEIKDCQTRKSKGIYESGVDMEPLLLLTKNYLAEKDLVRKLHELGYEVLSSTFLLHKLLQGQILFSNRLFEKILISLTVSNEEVEVIVNHLPNHAFSLYRLDALKEQDDTNELPLRERITYLNEAPSLRELREGFSLRQMEEVALETRHQEHYFQLEKNKLQHFLGSLSHKEKELFAVLYTKHGQATQRKDLVTAIWHRPPNSSQLAQLSQLINKLHNKLENAGLPTSFIVTEWKKGYLLSDEFFQNLSEEMKEFLDNL